MKSSTVESTVLNKFTNCINYNTQTTEIKCSKTVLVARVRNKNICFDASDNIVIARPPACFGVIELIHET